MTLIAQKGYMDNNQCTLFNKAYFKIKDCCFFSDNRLCNVNRYHHCFQGLSGHMCVGDQPVELVHDTELPVLRRSKDVFRHTLEAMGSNISRHSGKGLTGRRSQSSGNLCNAKSPVVSRILSPCGRDRYKLCGSLPNHLDSPPAPSCDVLQLLPPSSMDLSYTNEKPAEHKLLSGYSAHELEKHAYPFLHKSKHQ